MSDPASSDDLSIRIGRVAAPLREQVLDALREAILDFRLKPGQRLIERELIEQTGVSRTTIREVMRQLAAEGLIVSIPQRGAFVAVPSARQAADLAEVRATLEALAGRRFVLHATDEQVAELRAAAERVERVAQRAELDVQELLSANDAFYKILADGAGNPAIRDTLDTVRARVRVLRATSLSQARRPLKSAGELIAIVEAAEGRDEDATAAACERHVYESARSGLRGLTKVDPSATDVLATVPR